ncbi:acyl carrier protein [Streptomyces sp. UNOC14_S4]|uniref:acyl carrier protein n=1 Tax=Streptomyces sp. UNOC14_S4 TaxID=2872340 RepID=UPI001E60B847|nr:acyl carrier protein [Streptomyces sp. UNOC14_S4]MCC3771463.1 acyl carrier protein [Streptomyces sp. UNOC14_S4]
MNAYLGKGERAAVARRVAGLVRSLAESEQDALPLPGRDPDAFLDGLGSLAVVRLLVMVEEEFGIELASDDVVRENFRSLGALHTLVADRLGLPPDRPE